MSKKVLVIDNRIDLIKDHTDLLRESIKNKFMLVRNKKGHGKFVWKERNLADFGLLWLISEDFSPIMNDLSDFMLPGQFRAVTLKLGEGYTLTLEEGIEMINNLILSLKLIHSSQVNLKVCIDKYTNLDQVVRKLTSNIKLLGKIQVEFNESLEDDYYQKIKKASKLGALAKKYNIPINSCSCDMFNNPNIWIGCEPCVSGQSMERVMNTSMMKTQDKLNEGECSCHKYTNFSVAGEIFNENFHKINNRRDKKSIRGY